MRARTTCLAGWGRRVSMVAVAWSALTGAPGSGAAQNVKEVCASAYDQSQALRDDGKLLLARAQFTVCETACPVVLARDCTRWKDDVDARLSTIAPAARDQSGRAITDVKLRIDGRPPISFEAARELQLEPGRHDFRFERSDGSSVEVQRVLEERERGTPVVASFGGAADSGQRGDARRRTRPSPASSPSALVFIVGGVGVAALGVAGVLAIKGHVDRGALYDCRPDCSRGDVDSVATTWTVAGVAAGVGAIAVGVAVWLWASDRAGPVRSSLRRSRAEPAAAARPLRWSF